MGFLDKFKEFKNKFSKNNQVKVKKVKKPRYKVGLALGGGGTRGFAHLGALKAFEEEGIEFDYISGTSVGSLVGALYASGMSAQEIIDKAMELKIKDIRTSKLPFVPNKTEKLEEILKEYIGDAVFSDLKKPLTIVAVDLITAKEVHLESGSVIKAVAGSCAVPAVFNPVEYDPYILIDGGVQNTIPSDVLKNKGCKYVVAIDINPARGYGVKSTKLIDVIAASIRIMMKSNAERGKLFADIFITPDTKRFKATKLDGSTELIEEGYLAAKEAIPKIKKLLKIKENKPKTRKFFNKTEVEKEVELFKKQDENLLEEVEDTKE